MSEPLTKAQALVLGVLRAEPRSAKEIADELGLLSSSTRGHLMALGQKGIARRDLASRGWCRAELQLDIDAEETA